MADSTPPAWREAIRRYRDPMHPERPPHPRKVARSLLDSHTLDLDAATIERESEIAGIDPAEVYVELDALRARDAERKATEALDGSGWREKTITRDFDPEQVVDLRPLGGAAWKVVGTGNWLSDRERDSLRPGWFVLRCEPENPHDANAVAVYLDCRKIGYISAAKASAYNPILSSISADGFEVAGDISGPNAQVVLPQPSRLGEYAERAKG